jgi:TRAP-type mannitol/chloroaromatic compound transport system permease large subunit
VTALALLLALLVLVLINVPIAVALGVLAATAMVWKSGADSLLTAAVEMFNGAKSFPLIAIPLFVLAGAIMNTSGISRRLIAFASALLGFIRGGLSMVNIGTSMFFAEIMILPERWREARSGGALHEHEESAL